MHKVKSATEGIKLRNTPSLLRTVWLNEADHGRDNNLNLIRFLCATGVIFSHSWILQGVLDPAERYLRSCSLGDMAVRSFFFLSGYLILKSGLRGSDAGDFVIARALRILPALIVAIFACVFVLGPIVSILSVRAYFSSPETWVFLREMILYRTNDVLPGVFMQNIIHSVDGVLWTLPLEWSMYMVVLTACLISRPKSFWMRSPLKNTALVLGAFALLMQMMPFEHGPHARSWVTYFALGSGCYLLRRFIPLSVLVALLLAGGDLALIGTHGTLADIGTRLIPCILGYFLLTFGFHPSALFRSFLRLGDYSYGLYIFAFPIQQTAITYVRGFWMIFAISYPISLLMAIASWRYVEKPCLSLRSKLKRTREHPEQRAKEFA